MPKRRGKDSNCIPHRQFTLYSPNRCTSGIVEAVLHITDGPPPMKQMKPTNMKPTAADQFYKDHQEDYETRGRTPGRMRQVEQHNAYPKLTSELNKRRDVTRMKPTAADQFYKDHQEDYETRGRTPGRMRQVEQHNAYPKLTSELNKRRDVTRIEINKNNYTSAGASQSNKNNNGRPCNYKSCERQRNKKNQEKTGRITKNKKKRRRGREECMCLQNTTTQTKRKFITTATSALTIKVKEKTVPKPPAKALIIINDPLTLDSNLPEQKTSVHSKPSRSNISRHSKQSKSNVSRHPSSTKPLSVSSYHSFMSMDHEPMVSS